MNYKQEAMRLHRKYKGKIAIKAKIKLKTKKDLAVAYTPGVGRVSMAIARNKNLSFKLTNRANTIAIVTDGSAILGLGNIGPEAGMPVMEGKAAIFKEFAAVDAYPLCISSQETEDIVKFCQLIEPSVAGINLEDIAAPQCFTVLEKLEKKLSIPVFHDDQDGTAIVVLAALINALRITKKDIRKLKIVINGAGAAGIAITRLLLSYGSKNILLLDSKGIIYQGRSGLNIYKKQIALKTNKTKQKGDLRFALKNADVFIGVSKAGLVDKEMVRGMNKDSIIFAMANPNPEIYPQDAKNAGAYIVGTGRSDFPNQINNALVFPGIFRGLLDAGVKRVTREIKLNAAIGLANTVKKPNINKILPAANDQKAVYAIARAVKKTNSV